MGCIYYSTNLLYILNCCIYIRLDQRHMQCPVWPIISVSYILRANIGIRPHQQDSH